MNAIIVTYTKWIIYNIHTWITYTFYWTCTQRESMGVDSLLKLLTVFEKILNLRTYLIYDNYYFKCYGKFLYQVYDHKRTLMNYDRKVEQLNVAHIIDSLIYMNKMFK